MILHVAMLGLARFARKTKLAQRFACLCSISLALSAYASLVHLASVVRPIGLSRASHLDYLAGSSQDNLSFDYIQCAFMFERVDACVCVYVCE